MPKFDTTSMSMRLKIAALLAVSGGLVMLAIEWIEPMGDDSDLAIMVALAAFGAFASGFVTAPLFGQSGKRGVGWACLGAILATLLGAAVGGFLFAFISPPGLGRELVSFNNMLGFSIVSAFVVATFLATTFVGLVWGLVFCVVHLIGGFLRKAA